MEEYIEIKIKDGRIVSIRKDKIVCVVSDPRNAAQIIIHCLGNFPVGTASGISWTAQEEYKAFMGKLER